VSKFQAHPIYVPVLWNISLAPRPRVLRGCGCGCGWLRSRDVIGFGFGIVERVGNEGLDTEREGLLLAKLGFRSAGQ
jgi:hypothetical protein